MTALWNLGSENLSAARKLPPMSTRNWSARDDHYADEVSCLQSSNTKLRRSLDAGYLALTLAAATSAELKATNRHR
jgi:hypothetical protein